jgi:hypothetical protein
MYIREIKVAAMSKAYVCGRWIAGISSSNAAVVTDVCIL